MNARNVNNLLLLQLSLVMVVVDMLVATGLPFVGWKVKPDPGD